MPQIIEEWNDLRKILTDDYKKSIHQFADDPEDEYKRRAVYHFLFAFVEGIVSVFFSTVHFYKVFWNRHLRG
jgi:hypothetical protein